MQFGEGVEARGGESLFVRIRTLVVSAVAGALLVLAPAGLASTVAPAPQDAEAQFTELVNSERAAHGSARLPVAGDLVDVARRHAERMAAEGRLYHNPNLGSEVQNWQTVGENVGTGPSVEEIHQAFMASGSHRGVILDGTFTQVGIGVAIKGDTIWVAQVFRNPMPPPEPAPAPEPARVDAARETRAAPAPAPAPPQPQPVAAAPVSTAAEPVAPDLSALNQFQAPDGDAVPDNDGAVLLSGGLSVPVPSPEEIPMPVKVAASMLVAVVAAQVATAWRYRLVAVPVSR